MLADGDKGDPPGSKELPGIKAAEVVVVEDPPPADADVAEVGPAETGRLAETTAGPPVRTGTPDPPDLGEGTGNPTKFGTGDGGGVIDLRGF